MQKQLKNGNFVYRLQGILNNLDYAHIITWDDSKRYIDILDSQKLQTDITPLYFRHNKFESFVRQLNLYGFRKIKNHGILRFTHPLLLDGLSIDRIASIKGARGQRKIKDQPEAPQVELSVELQAQRNRIPAISITVKAEAEQIEINRDERRHPRGIWGAAGQFPAGFDEFGVSKDYLNWWNWMSMMSVGNYWPSMMNHGPLPPYNFQ